MNEGGFSYCNEKIHLTYNNLTFLVGKFHIPWVYFAWKPIDSIIVERKRISRQLDL